MSELREQILGTGINKKRIIGIVLVAILLIAMFAFSTIFFSFLFGSQRTYPSRELDGTEDEDALLLKPPFPFDEDFWKDLLDQVDDPEALLDLLSEMFDGDIDDLDLSNFSQGLLDLLFNAGAGEIELFRVYDYLSFDDMENVLWKYECFDEYTGQGWTSNAATDIYDFFSYARYLLDYSPNPELLKIKMPMSPNVGINSMVLPTLFPTPFVIDGSFSAPNLESGTETLYKNEYNSTTIDLSFNSDEDVNITFNMFGLYNFLPTNEELNSSAVDVTTPSPDYLSLQSKYLQLPPSIEVYKANNQYFNTQFNILDGIIDPSDNAFVVANKIRNYLQTNFSFPMTQEDYNPVPEGRDVVDWFCETQQGLWSDFASAFCAFSRAFGVISRFVDGFNSYMIEEFFDDDEGQDGFAIKYKNLYNWAEVYIPTDITGDGEWAQFDIFDNFAGGGGIPIGSGAYNITVSTNQTAYTRPSTANISAIVSSNTEPSVEGMTLTFTDYSTGQTLGQADTDINGSASIEVDFDSTFIVGPHLIEAKYDFFTAGYNLTTILGDISIALTDVNPAEINISDAQDDETNIVGYVYDPLNGLRVEGPELNIILFEKGTTNEVFNAFSPSSINATSNGVFDDLLDVNHNVAGNYEVRADLNGTWWIDTPLGSYDYLILTFGFQVPYYLMTNSSIRMDLNITKALDVLFYIDGIPADNPNSPLVSRYQTLTLTTRLVSVVHGPMSNREVYFYDYSRGNIFINSDITNASGYATINYFVGDYCRAGPNLLYARFGLQQNYSYFILNEIPTINIISGPTPRVINRSGSGATQFNIVGEIYDSTTNSLPISFSEITLTLLNGGVNYSQYLVPSENYPYQTDSTGNFDLTFGVAYNTPPGNYTLRLDFNGTINLSSYPYSYQFDLPVLTTSTLFINDLQVDAEASLLFWINGFTSDNFNNPQITRDQDLTLTTYIHQAGDPVQDDEWVYFYDVTQDNLYIGADQTSGGYASVVYDTDGTTTAGPHLIYATWNNKYNYSYFILNDEISINLDICPQPREINRSGSIDINFLIHGYLNDSYNGNPIKYGQISVHLLYGVTDYSSYLNLVSGSLILDESGEIDLIFSVSPSTPARNYTLEVRFNGLFDYTGSNYPNYFDLFLLSNFTHTANGFYELKVKDPDNIVIQFFIDGNPSLDLYDDFFPPERYNQGDSINFSVYITQGGTAVNSGTAILTDIFTGTPLGTQPVSNGQCSFYISDLSSWHAGLHEVRISWSGAGTYNRTYIIINESVNIFANIDISSILRNVDSFTVWGTVQESGELLRGLIINIRLFDNTMTDVSGLYLNGFPTSVITNDLGYFQFDQSIDLGCPQGNYYIRIDFNGSIFAPGIDLSDYMIHNSSLLIPININAGTFIIQDSWYTDYDSIYPEYSDYWIIYDTLHVIGNLYWDNGSAMSNMYVNVTIKLLDGTVIAFNDTVQTDSFGLFNVSIFIDAYANWPELRNESEIWVYFDPIVNGVPYVEGSELEFT